MDTSTEDASTNSIEEDIEPKLKYKRLQNNLLDILSTDAASCIAVHPKFIAVGTHWGFIYLLDHEGNSTESKKFKVHTVSVNQVSIDAKGEYLATCSDDGKIFIHGLCSKEHNQYYNIGRLIKSVSIDPYYYKANGRRFITGDEKLSIHEKTFLGRLRSQTLCESEGFVQNMAWSEHFVAWASDIGVRVYDINARCSLGLIKWEDHSALGKFRCNLRWSDSRTLLIGWVDTVRVCVIRKRTLNDAFANKDLPEYLVDPISTFRVDFYICGIAPLDHLLVLLGFPKDRDENGKSLRPQLFILEFMDNDYTEICTDVLSLRGYQEYSTNDYHLDVLIEENRFFVVAPKDIVVASQYDLDDRLQWLKNHCKYEEGLEVLMNSTSGRENRRFTIVNFGIEYIDFLLNQKQYDKAGQICRKIFGFNKSLWEEHIYKFATVHQLRSVSQYIPASEEGKLDKHIYEMVLYEYLKMDAHGFLRLVKEWNHTLYDPSVVINAVLEQLLISDRDDKVFLESLALLYSYEKQYDKSLSMYLTLKNKDVFMLIQKHQLYTVIKDMIVELMELDQEKAIALFLEKNRVPSETVVQKLSKHPHLLYKYLDAYDKIDTRKQYHGTLVRLYAIFDRDKLLPLLRRSENYPIQEAIDVCEQAKFYPELVFLLARIGDFKEALQLIVERLGDVRHAIAFCQEQNDADLWRDLIDHCVDKPHFVAYLLQTLGTYMDPTVLIEKIPAGLSIPGLKESLIKMLRAYNLQVSVQEGCKRILVADYFNLHDKLVRAQQRGLLVATGETSCGACHHSLGGSTGDELFVFNCRHAFHAHCLPPDVSLDACPVCHECTASTAYLPFD